MGEESGGRESDARWILTCEGMSVDGPDGRIGRIAHAIYEPSARWDRPTGFAVASADGTVVVPLDAVGEVRAGDRTVVLREAPAADGLRL